MEYQTTAIDPANTSRIDTRASFQPHANVPVTQTVRKRGNVQHVPNAPRAGILLRCWFPLANMQHIANVKGSIIFADLERFSALKKSHEVFRPALQFMSHVRLLSDNWNRRSAEKHGTVLLVAAHLDFLKLDKLRGVQPQRVLVRFVGNGAASLRFLTCILR